MRVKCPHCSTDQDVSDDTAGLETMCSGCKEWFPVPSRSRTPRALAPAPLPASTRRLVARCVVWLRGAPTWGQAAVVFGTLVFLVGVWYVITALRSGETPHIAPVEAATSEGLLATARTYYAAIARRDWRAAFRHEVFSTWAEDKYADYAVAMSQNYPNVTRAEVEQAKVTHGNTGETLTRLRIGEKAIHLKMTWSFIPDAGRWIVGISKAALQTSPDLLKLNTAEVLLAALPRVPVRSRVLHSWGGAQSKSIPVFTVPQHTTFQWACAGRFSANLFREYNGEWRGVLATTFTASAGSKYIRQNGKYYIDVQADGMWLARIVSEAK